MKELSIEEKAKRYDEAIERAKIWQEHLYDVNDKDYADELNYIFPELKEGEDEKTKRILYSISSKISFHLRDIFTEEEFQCFDAWSNAWLKKQEQKPDDKAKPKFKVGDRVIGIVSGMQYFITKVCDDHYNTESGCIIMFSAQDNFELVEQQLKKIEQKPTDEEMKRLLQTEYEKGRADAIAEMQKFAEWGEEDKKFKDKIMHSLIYNIQLTVEDMLDINDWFDSLKKRYTWKPSDEQMKALNYVVNLMASSESPRENDYYYNVFKDLRKQLKKLREE